MLSRDRVPPNERFLSGASSADPNRGDPGYAAARMSSTSGARTCRSASSGQASTHHECPRPQLRIPVYASRRTTLGGLPGDDDFLCRGRGPLPGPGSCSQRQEIPRRGSSKLVATRILRSCGRVPASVGGAIRTARLPDQARRHGAGGGFRTHDLQIMSLACWWSWHSRPG